MMGAHSDADAAVDATVADNVGFAPPHPDGLGRALPDAVCAALAFLRVQRNRVKHGIVLIFIEHVLVYLPFIHVSLFIASQMILPFSDCLTPPG
jgi:hypothetical protein